ncbi:MAG: hypothetical protein WBA41_25005 [Rivularia sp. (in: cyanobacteria)]
MSTRGVRLTHNQVKRLLGGAMLCLSLSMTVACQQAKKSSSNNNAQDLTILPANRKNNEDIPGIPQKTPGEITVNQPSVNPAATPQATSSDPRNPASVPQQTQGSSDRSASESDNSIPKALTEKLSPQAASQPNIPKPQTQTQPIPAKPVVEALRTEAKNPARRIAAASNTNVYRSQRLGVNFKYPKGFVIKEPQDTSSSSKVLELWSLKDYQAVAEGKSKNTHLPGNMSISLENNPQGLSLVQWVSNNDELGDIIPESYNTKVVAGKEAVSFRTEGLYEFDNIVLPSSDGKKVILISFAKGDNSYQKVFDQVVSTLQVN